MSRNLKATGVVTGLYAIALVLGLFGAMVKPETRITGTIAGKPVDIPAWLQNEPEYDKKIKNAKVDQGWGGLRLLLWGVALVPAGLGLALSGERQAELEKERREYDRQTKEEELLADVQTAYKVGLKATLLKKRGEATVALEEDRLEEEVDSIREANGWFAPANEQSPQRAIEPPLLREKEPMESNPFEGMKTPEQYAIEIEAARQGAIARMKTISGSTEADELADKMEQEVCDRYQQRGREIMSSMVNLKMSILNVAPTGAGKTHTLDKWLEGYLDTFPSGEAYVIAQKNDPFMGLADKGFVKLFDPFSPEVALSYLDKVYAIMQQRLKTPKHDRKKFDFAPIRLILDDWYSIYQVLKLDAALWRTVSIKLSSIITLGREVNVCLYICTQSYILAALGLAEDSNIRSNLAIVCQGFVRIFENIKQGDFGVLKGIIKNDYIVPGKEDKERLAREIEELVKLSNIHQVPIWFSSIGTPTLALAPRIAIALGDDVSTSTNVAVADKNEVQEGISLWEQFEKELAWRREQINLNSDCINANAPDGEDEPDDDSTDVSGDDSCINAGINAESNAQSGLPDYEEKELEYLKHLPPTNELLKMLENSPEGYSLPNFIRNRLKVTTASNARRTKRAIVGLVKKLNRADLWDKFELHKFNNL